MNQLKAFVGYSFTDNDEAVARAFLKFFELVKNMNIGFSWEHAEPAEPKELAEKVLRLMEDKNLFIGICTSKEAAIQADKLRRGALKKKILKAEEMHFTLKTSDWIIQEIGLAKGRNMGSHTADRTGCASTRRPTGQLGIHYLRTSFAGEVFR